MFAVDAARSIAPTEFIRALDIPRMFDVQYIEEKGGTRIVGIVSKRLPRYATGITLLPLFSEASVELRIATSMLLIFQRQRLSGLYLRCAHRDAIRFDSKDL